MISGLLLLLVGCTTRFAYNNLDYLIAYRIDDYVDLTRLQDRVLDQGLETALERHRKQGLPAIHRALDSLQADVMTPMTLSQIRRYHYLFTDLGQDAAAMVGKPVASMLSLLSDRQVTELDREIQARFNEVDAERKALTPAQRLDKRTDRLIDTLQDWVGRSTPEQRAMLKELAGYQLEMTPVFLAMRQHYWQTWQSLLAQRTQAGFSTQLTQWMRNLVAFNTAQHSNAMDVYLNRRFELMLRLQHSLSDKQRHTLNRNLVDLRKDVAVLIQQ
ncbi:DUF6279 family lipoprotein [Photobacterium japonica]|uniref:DUF6279 family lipoprotein n=1 Tax=Photobacterium japonica TaxID=2910235 RepID=UPI003D107E08